MAKEKLNVDVKNNEKGVFDCITNEVLEKIKSFDKISDIDLIFDKSASWRCIKMIFESPEYISKDYQLTANIPLMRQGRLVYPEKKTLYNTMSEELSVADWISFAEKYSPEMNSRLANAYEFLTWLKYRALYGEQTVTANTGYLVQISEVVFGIIKFNSPGVLSGHVPDFRLFKEDESEYPLMQKIVPVIAMDVKED